MRERIRVRPTSSADIPQLIELCRRVYPSSPPYGPEQLRSQLEVFPEGQLVAVGPGERVAGMAASLIISWEDYDIEHNWRDFTDGGFFTNHDPAGRTLYGAEVMVDPERQRQGIGGLLYRERRRLAQRLGMRRIRAGARLRGYARHASRLTPQAYVEKVLRGELRDPTLSFQIKQGFRVIAVVGGYLQRDPESLGYAAVIEWLNPILGSQGPLTSGALSSTES